MGCIAVTDHNTVAGALEALALSEADPTLPRVIPGVEISTADGDVVGPVRPRGHTAGEAHARVHRPHQRAGRPGLSAPPYDALRRGAIAAHVREQAAEQADIIEVLNGRSLTYRSVRNSYELARRHGKPEGAGSDAHVRTEVGGAYVTIDRLPTRDDLVDLVAAGAVREGLRLHEYILNWALQPWAVLTRFRRKGVRKLLRR